MDDPIDLTPLSTSDLRVLFDRGEPVPARELEGRCFRGISLGLPSWLERLTWKTFAKVFIAEGGRVRGFNLRIEQRGLEPPYRVRQRRARFGEFEVIETDTAYVDYAPENPWWSPMSRVRDRLVALGDGRILGRALVRALHRELGTPSYFVLTPGLPLPPDLVLADAHHHIAAI